MFFNFHCNANCLELLNWALLKNLFMWALLTTISHTPSVETCSYWMWCTMFIIVSIFRAYQPYVSFKFTNIYIHIYTLQYSTVAHQLVCRIISIEIWLHDLLPQSHFLLLLNSLCCTVLYRTEMCFVFWYILCTLIGVAVILSVVYFFLAFCSLIRTVNIRFELIHSSKTVMHIIIAEFSWIIYIYIRVLVAVLLLPVLVVLLVLLCVVYIIIIHSFTLSFVCSFILSFHHSFIFTGFH